MKYTTIIILASLLSNAAQGEVTFDWATVGNPGNAADDTGFGAVDYVYRISKHEVTNSQYVEFLNSVDPLGFNERLLYDPEMSSKATGGIRLDSSAANGSKYNVKPGHENTPVTHVRFADAARFTNWLHNGQVCCSTEAGVYEILPFGAIRDRTADATFFIPTENEWYKAAYHKNDGVTANYWNYPTSNDDVPFSDQPPGSDAPTQSNTGNFVDDDRIDNGYNDGFAVTGTPEFSDSQNYLTEVGAYRESVSPYGTFDQGGNVWEITETIFDNEDPSRIERGGSWDLEPNDSSVGHRSLGLPLNIVGFRVAASVPEPSTAILLALAAAFTVLTTRR